MISESPVFRCSREQLAGRYIDNVTREGFQIAHDISSYSFTALAKAGLPMMDGRAGSLITLSYLGAERSVPFYNVMGLAKASLEANVRYMAADLGPDPFGILGPDHAAGEVAVDLFQLALVDGHVEGGRPGLGGTGAQQDEGEEPGDHQRDQQGDDPEGHACSNTCRLT